MTKTLPVPFEVTQCDNYYAPRPPFCLAVQTETTKQATHRRPGTVVEVRK